jgi:hypothetical protein
VGRRELDDFVAVHPNTSLCDALLRMLVEHYLEDKGEAVLPVKALNDDFLRIANGIAASSSLPSAATPRPCDAHLLRYLQFQIPLSLLAYASARVAVRTCRRYIVSARTKLRPVVLLLMEASLEVTNGELFSLFKTSTLLLQKKLLQRLCAPAGN